MNYLKQINAFWIKFNHLPDGRPYHISLYFSLCHINNRCGWRIIFDVEFEEILQLSKLDKDTYYKGCRYLFNKGFLEIYQKGRNQYQSARFSIKKLSDISESFGNAQGMQAESLCNNPDNNQQINLKTNQNDNSGNNNPVPDCYFVGEQDYQSLF